MKEKTKREEKLKNVKENEEHEKVKRIKLKISKEQMKEKMKIEGKKKRKNVKENEELEKEKEMKETKKESGEQMKEKTDKERKKERKEGNKIQRDNEAKKIKERFLNQDERGKISFRLSCLALHPHCLISIRPFYRWLDEYPFLPMHSLCSSCLTPSRLAITA